LKERYIIVFRDETTESVIEQTLSDLKVMGITQLSRFTVIPAATVDIPDSLLPTVATLTTQFPAIEVVDEDRAVTTMPGPIIVSTHEK
jgi:hypothetical protein